MAVQITAEWERLESGTPEERACFAAVGIFAGAIALSEAEDTRVKRLRSSVHLSAYRLAEWFAWNGWRQRWEPRADTLDWAMAHRMSTIGGGYVWPNITLISDGERMVLLAKPTKPCPAEPLRYIADLAVAVPAAEFERAVAEFVEQVCGQLRAEGIAETNLDHAWRDLLQERTDPEVAERRRLEALLGHDPDEAEPHVLDGLLADARNLGAGAVRELAAMSATGGPVLSGGQLSEIARSQGFEARPGAAVRLESVNALPPAGRVAAWKRGAQAAKALRDQERLAAGPIVNEKLTSLCGVTAATITDLRHGADLSFAIDDPRTGSGQVVLRSRWETGRRFELARLLGDRIAAAVDGRLHPATRSYTYRQKVQRAFAAELLCPFEAMEERLAGDYSDEKQDEVASDFKVSPLTVRTLLVNHGRIERDSLDSEPDPVLAA